MAFYRLALVAVLAACACSNDPAKGKTPETPTPVAQAPATTTPPPVDPAPAKTPAEPAAPAAPQPQPAPVAPPKPTKGGTDFGKEARLLSQLAVCTEGDEAEADAAMDNRTRRGLCKNLERQIKRWTTRWRDRAMPKLAEIVPDDLPKTVVYPFGGGDLLTALATFPDATEITTMSLEVPGDVRTIKRYRKGKLTEHLKNSHTFARFLLQVSHSKTTNMMQTMRSVLPGQLIFGFLGFRLYDQEIVSLRYFDLDAEGNVQYLEEAEIDKRLGAARGSKEKAKVFSMVEVEFKAKGKDDAPLRVWRHIAFNLGNKALEGSPLLAHLKKKGKVAAMTKAASYLLWWTSFKVIRNYLLDNMVWMISDSTGIPPRYAKKRGFEQIPYGAFEKPFLDAGDGIAREFVRLYAQNKKRRLIFRYGYPDGSEKKLNHLIVTRLKQPE